MIRLALIPWTLTLALVGTPARADHDDDDGDDGDEAEVDLGDVPLNAAQRHAIREIADQARKEKLRAAAELKILEIDLRRELAREMPDERKVGELVDRLTGAEGRTRKARILAALRVKRLLAAEQRRQLGRERAAVAPVPPLPPVPPRAVPPARPPRPECDEQNDDRDDDADVEDMVDPLRDRDADADDDDDLGILKIVAKPYARLSIDGRDTGRFTPHIMRLSPGRHVIGLKPAKGKTVRFTIVIKAGQATTVLRDLTAY